MRSGPVYRSESPAPSYARPVERYQPVERYRREAPNPQQDGGSMLGSGIGR